MVSKLTPTQQAALDVLKLRPGIWMTAYDIWHILNPGCTPAYTEIGNLGTSLRHLQRKTNDLLTKMSGRDRLYSIDSASPEISFKEEKVTSTKNDILSQVKDASNDPDIMMEALLHYSVHVIGEDRGRALRAAFLAGRESRSSQRSQKNQAKRTSVEGTTETQAAEVQLGPPMPSDMTYEDLVEKAAQAYNDQKFLYEEVAQRAGMNTEYVRKILKGDATPTRDTMNRVFSATFLEG